MNWTETVKSYMDKRLMWVFMLGCSSGFPWVLIGSNMSGWLKDEGLSRSAIGYFGSVFVVYAINFLWAPLIDRIKLPVLHKALGQRRSWILSCQFMILIGTLSIAHINPANNLILTSLIALSIALFSATQDIAIDAFRIDSFTKQESDKMPQASAMSVIGWWTGYSLPGYLAFMNADSIGWNKVYLGMACIIVLLMLFTLLTREPVTEREYLQKQAEEQHSQVVGSRLMAWLTVTVAEPFIDFFKRNGVQVAITLLSFVFLFKIGEAFLGRMSIVFYKEVGFSNEQIAQYSKLLGWGSTIVFTLLGSLFNVRFGIVKGLMIGGIAMAASNLMFSVIAIYQLNQPASLHNSLTALSQLIHLRTHLDIPPNELLFVLTILVDNFTSAFATVAFVSFLTLLTGQAFSATQYALLASLGNLGRTTLASFSGNLADYLNDWSVFFIVTALMVIPSLLMLYSLRDYFEAIIKKNNENNH